MSYRYFVAIAALFAATSAPAQIKFLDKANGFLSKITGVPVSGTSGGGPRTGTGAMARQTSDQMTAQGKALATPGQPEIMADRAAAKPLIDQIVSTSACALNDSAWNRLNRQMETPDTFANYQFHTPVGKIRYGSKTSCLDIIRVTSWKKPAKNALTFEVQLISPVSDEAVRQQFTLIRNEDGEWLVRQIGFAT